MRPWAGVEYYPEHMRGGHVSKRVSVDISLDALQAAIGEWPGVGEVATELGTNQHHIHDMLDDGRLKGISYACRVDHSPRVCREGCP